MLFLSLSCIKNRLVGETETQTAPKNNNGILKSATISVLIKYLSNFRRFVERLLINCKVVWSKHSIVATVSVANGGANSNNTFFLLSKTQNHMFLSSFHQQKTLKKLRKLLSKGFERSVYWNEHKTKSENENKTSKYIYFIQSNLFVLIYSNQDNYAKIKNPKVIMYQKVLSKLYRHHEW